MTLDDDGPVEYAELHYLAGLAARMRTAIQYSLAQSLAEHFPPPKEPSPQFRAILKRMEEL